MFWLFSTQLIIINGIENCFPNIQKAHSLIDSKITAIFSTESFLFFYITKTNKGKVELIKNNAWTHQHFNRFHFKQNNQIKSVRRKKRKINFLVLFKAFLLCTNFRDNSVNWFLNNLTKNHAHSLLTIGTFGIWWIDLKLFPRPNGTRNTVIAGRVKTRNTKKKSIYSVFDVELANVSSTDALRCKRKQRLRQLVEVYLHFNELKSFTSNIYVFPIDCDWSVFITLVIVSFCMFFNKLFLDVLHILV